MQSVQLTRLKEYEPPLLKKLTEDQALEFLRHHAKLGDQGAKDILKLLPVPTNPREG